MHRKINYTFYRNFEADDNFIYELLNGRLVKKKANSPNHQLVSSKIIVLLSKFIEEYELGEIFFGPLDVFLDEYNAPQPDLLFISAQKSKIISDININGIPDLVVEIISPSSLIRDRVEKKNLYERFQIPEFWMVDPQNKSIEIYVLNDEKTYELNNFATNGEGEIKSIVLKKFSLKLEELFV